VRGDAYYVCAEAEGFGRGALWREEAPSAGSGRRLFRFSEKTNRSICISVLHTCWFWRIPPSSIWENSVQIW
jgi:hypothetical protein